MDFKSNFPPKAMESGTTIQLENVKNLGHHGARSFLKKL
jgi:hypothetical protein